jgi:hypothetical protein
MLSEIVFFSNIAKEVLKRRFATFFVIWAVCRRLDKEGAGWVVVSDLCQALEEAGIFRSYYTKKILRDNPTSPFWQGTDKKGRLRYNSPAAVAAALGLQHPGTARFVRVQELRSWGSKGTAQRRAVILAATFEADQEKAEPRSQFSIQKDTGVSPRTQRRYRRLGVFHAERQTARFPQATDYEKKYATQALASFGFYEKEQVLTRRLPNKYWAEHKLGPRARCKTRRALTNAARPTLRVYFPAAKQYARYQRPKAGTEEVNFLPVNSAYVPTRDAGIWEAAYIGFLLDKLPYYKD